MTDVRVTVKLTPDAAGAILASDGVQAEMDRRAELMASYQRATVPVDTGLLREHIQIRPNDDGKGRFVGVFDKVPLKPADYVLCVELGYEHWISGEWIPAQPFIRPSIDAAKG